MCRKIKYNLYHRTLPCDLAVKKFHDETLKLIEEWARQVEKSNPEIYDMSRLYYGYGHHERYKKTGYMYCNSDKCIRIRVPWWGDKKHMGNEEIYKSGGFGEVIGTFSIYEFVHNPDTFFNPYDYSNT